MLQPTRTKYRKAFKGRIHGNSTRAAILNYGEFGLKAMQPERIIGKSIFNLEINDQLLIFPVPPKIFLSYVYLFSLSPMQQSCLCS